jgi:ABC-type multidrug transport system fused ATPase/permease subunit
MLCIMFAIIGVVAGGSMLLMNAMYARTGELLTMRLRTMTFEKIINQEIAYFDDRRHTTGALCSRLATDASIVRGAAGSRIGYVVQSIAAIGAGLIIGFVYSWQLTLLVLAFAPFMLISGFIQMRVVQTRGGKSDPIEQAGSIAVEGIENIRTVATLTKEENFLRRYTEELDKVYSKRRKEAHIVSIAFSVSQSIIFFADAACFMFGAYLIDNGKLVYDDMFKVFFAIIFGAMAAGRAASFAPDYGKALVAAGRLFYLLDRVPNPDSSSESGSKLQMVDGSVKVNEVSFNYPTRPDIVILKEVSLEVKPGQMVALVGSSGCGKSTIVQLIERFYNPASGTLSLDDHTVDSLHIQWLRQQIGIVSQEPVLFDCTIRENIAYGDNSREVSMEEIISAAKQANIHNFISTLPQGYETGAGDKGAQLSGGQKQRIAIARALVRNPKILLLDEATSALDTESEKVVQEALERAQEGRTSIVIAHRLSTIQNAHSIIVLKHGRVVEVGTHSKLMAQQGVYYKLNTSSVHH